VVLPELAEKYEVLGVLGEGGTGKVYDAVHLPEREPVALKVIHAQLAGDAQIRGRFRREVEILKRLAGKHVCPVIDHGEVPSVGSTGSVLYLAMAKIPGRSLDQIVAKERLSIDKALDVMLQVCAGLKAAHTLGIVHRDLKPANVLIDESGEVHVVDFGMAKIITGGGTGTTNLTAHNMVFGTPEYMAPEQARGDELDARCDVYSAGVMLYELLTGSPPFTGPTPLAVLTEHLTSDVERPRKRAPARGISEAIEAVIMHALARDPDERYPSASALASAIVHAKAEPENVESLRPRAFNVSPEGTDAYAQTIPAMDVPLLIPSSPPPRLTPSAPPPSKSAGAASRPTQPSPSASSASHGPSRGMWVIVWVIAGIVSVAAGAWLATR
jgi:eukaryotic-like serine/threonine-protein kinase